MAALLVRVIDKVNEDFYLNTKCTKRGDVIVVQEDDWAWGSEELTNFFWRILIHRELTLSEARAWLAEERDTDPVYPSRTLQRRWFKLDVDALNVPPLLRQYLADNARLLPLLDITEMVPLDQFRLWKIMKPPIEDPAVFG